MEDRSLRKVDETSNMKPAFDRSAALRRVWLMMDSPRCKIVKKKPPKKDNPDSNGGGAAHTIDRRVKAAGVAGQFPQKRKHPERPACEESPKVPFCKHFSETEEERSERLAGYMERYRRATQNESPEKRQKRLERLEEEKKAKSAMPYTGRIRSNRYNHETEEQRQKRLARYAKYNRMRLENETAEKRERRLEFSKIATKRSYEHKLLKEKLMMDNNQRDPSNPTTSRDITTMDLGKGIEESQAHLRYAKVVTNRRRIVAEAIDKEHLEEMLAIAEESLMMNVKKETGSGKFGENSNETVDNLRRNGNEAPVQNIKTEKLDNMANGKKLSNPMAAPKAIMKALASKAPSVQIISEKQDHCIIPGNDSRTTSQDVQFLQLKAEPFKPDNVTTLDNSPDIVIVPVINPSVTLNLPLLHNKPENPKQTCESPMPFSDSQLKSKGLDIATSLQNHPNLVIMLGNNSPTNAQDMPVLPKGPEKQCEASAVQQVTPVPFSNLQKPSNKVLSRVRTEKLVQLVTTQHSPKIIQVDNLQSITKGISLLQNRNGGSDHLISANAPKMVPVPLMTQETGSGKLIENSNETVDNLQRNGNEAPVQNIKTEKLDNMANGEILSNLMAAPKAIMKGVASKAPSVQIVTEKQDHCIIPGNYSRTTSQDVQFLQLKPKPLKLDNVTTLDNSPDIVIMPVINPSVSLNLPLLHNKPENPNHIVSRVNSNQVMPMPFSDSQQHFSSQLKSKGLDLAASLQNHPNLVIMPVNNGPANAQDMPVLPKGPEKQFEAFVEQQVTPVPFSNLQKPSNKVLSQRVKTEKLVQLVTTQHSPKIIQVDNLQSIEKGISLLQNRNGRFDHLISANAPKIVPVPLMTLEVPLLQFKTEKPDHASVEVDNHAISSMPEPKITPKLTFVNDFQSVSKRTPVLLSLLNKKPCHTSIGKNVPGCLNVTANKVPLASLKSIKPDYPTIQNHTLKKPYTNDMPVPKITSGISEGNMPKRSADVFLPMVNPVNAVVGLPVINQLTLQDFELESAIQYATSLILNSLSKMQE